MPSLAIAAIAAFLLLQMPSGLAQSLNILGSKPRDRDGEKENGSKDGQNRSPIYDIHRQVFTQHMLFNSAVRNINGTSQALVAQARLALSAYLDVANPLGTATLLQPSPAYQAQYGRWQVVWGPALKTGPSIPGATVVNNGIFVSYASVRFPQEKDYRPTYIVASSGLNMVSPFSLLVEALLVNTTVPFLTWDALAPFVGSSTPPGPNVPVISYGTAVGVREVLTAVSPLDGPAPGLTLLQFLQSLRPKKGATIIFAGHGLAGASSPTLALYLKLRGKLAAFDRVLTYPTAGLTPGNRAFAQLYATQFPAIRTGNLPHQVWNHNVYNELDLIPHNWNQAMLTQAPFLFGNTPANVPPAIAMLAARRRALAAQSGIDYQLLRSQVLVGGKVFPFDGLMRPLPVPPQDPLQFLAQAVQQHGTAYVMQPGNQPGLLLERIPPLLQIPRFERVNPIPIEILVQQLLG